MDLWIRSSAKANLLQVNFLTIMNGNEFYEKKDWEYKEYTICNVGPSGHYEILGTYKTKERALEVLDEINEIKYYKYMASLDWKSFVKSIFETKTAESQKILLAMMNTYQMPKE